MGLLKRGYFGPADSVTVECLSGLSLPEKEAQESPQTRLIAYLHHTQSALVLTAEGFSESDAHFLIRFIEGMGLLEGFPEVPAQKMDEFLDVLRELFILVKGLQDGFGVQDVQNVIRILDRLYNLLH